MADISRPIRGNAKKKMMMITNGGKARIISTKITIGSENQLYCMERIIANARPSDRPVIETATPKPAVIPMP